MASLALDKAATGAIIFQIQLGIIEATEELQVPGNSYLRQVPGRIQRKPISSLPQVILPEPGDSNLATVANLSHPEKPLLTLCLISC